MADDSQSVYEDAEGETEREECEEDEEEEEVEWLTIKIPHRNPDGTIAREPPTTPAQQPRELHVPPRPDRPIRSTQKNID
jgi:hypothetical protein